MKFAFFGSPRFAELVLEKLIGGGYVPSLVVCNPDRPVGRKQVLTAPPIKTRIMNYELEIREKIKIWQPEKLEIGEVDFAIVAAYAKIIPKSVLEVPRLGTIGVHPSLLPRYRGASPIQTAILEGGEETGVTLYLMDERLDHGPILAQKRAIIGQNEDYPELEERLAGLGGELLLEVLPGFLEGEVKAQAQDEMAATFTKKFTTQDAFVNYSDLLDAEAGDLERALKIHRMIRAFVLEPGAWTLRPFDSAQSRPALTSTKVTASRQGRLQRVKFLESEVIEDKLKLKKIQVEGEKPRVIANNVNWGG